MNSSLDCGSAHHKQSYVDSVTKLRTRFPFFDVRLVNFCAALPSAVVSKKGVLVQAMTKRLPSAVLYRPKSGITGDLLRTRFQAGILKAPEDFGDSTPAFLDWIDPKLYEAGFQFYLAPKGRTSTWEGMTICAPARYLSWLKSRGDPDMRGVCNERS